jgi:23S rRNA pseudouridine2605 synthase
MRGKLDTTQRIAKALSRAGVASRRQVEKLVMAGQVSVNGLVITDPATKVAKTDKIAVNGNLVSCPQNTRIWLYHKPSGLVSSSSDEKGRETIFDKLPKNLPRLMSIGRLDLPSEGLLLLTNDGELKRHLELPATGFLRTYKVRANGKHSEVSINKLRGGIVVEGENFRPMEVKLDKVQGANIWYTVALKEGRNREIRRAFSQINLSVNRLIRTSFGLFELGTLGKGEVKEVHPMTFIEGWGKLA